MISANFKMKLPTIEDVRFTINIESDDTRVKGNASAIDDKTDAEIEQSINRQLSQGNQWAWCIVTVECKYLGIIGTDSLGCCSYNNEQDFISGGYYEDMKQSALNDLIAQVKGMSITLSYEQVN